MLFHLIKNATPDKNSLVNKLALADMIEINDSLTISKDKLIELSKPYVFVTE